MENKEKKMPIPGMKKTEASEKKMPEGQMGNMKMTSSGEIPIPQMGDKSSHHKMPRGAKPPVEKIP